MTLLRTPPVPYVAVIFTSRRAAEDGYAEVAARMEAMVAAQPGYLGHEGARGSDGLGITVSYWKDEASAMAWKDHLDHAEARGLGRARFYEAFTVRVAVVARQFDSADAP